MLFYAFLCLSRINILAHDPHSLINAELAAVDRKFIGTRITLVQLTVGVVITLSSAILFFNEHFRIMAVHMVKLHNTFGLG